MQTIGLESTLLSETSQRPRFANLVNFPEMAQWLPKNSQPSFDASRSFRSA